MSSKLQIEDHLRTLGLRPDATGDAVRKAFRRLAREHHPDLNATPTANARFVAIVQAYRALQHELGLHPDRTHDQRCPRCGRFDELLTGLDGRAGCPECLLGRAGARHFLPLPIMTTVRHVGVLVLYAASVVLAVTYAQNAALPLAALSLICALAGLLLLFVTCLTVPETW